MSVLPKWLKGLAGRQFAKKAQVLNISGHAVRTYADTPKADTTSKQIMINFQRILTPVRVQGYIKILKQKSSKGSIKEDVQVQGTENEERVRVRRARPGDVPRVLRFVREHARIVWPGLAAPPAQPQIMLCDYVARALAQGHSMLAEQQEPRRGWSQIRGLALGGTVCPWDATSLEKWARCVRCVRSRRLMHFTAHCLRAPALHDKYKVHNILQVVLIVPPDNPKSTEIVNILAKHAIKRGKEFGFPLMRFDVTNDSIAKSLEAINLKKEWQLTYDVLPDILRDQDASINDNTHSKETSGDKSASNNKPIDRSYIAVYTAITGDPNLPLVGSK